MSLIKTLSVRPVWGWALVLGFAGPLQLLAQPTIAPAAEVRFPTAAGAVYALEFSPDMEDWSALETFVVGDGNPFTRTISLAGEGMFARLRGEPVQDLGAVLHELRATQQVPAFAAAVIKDGKLVGVGVSGHRRSGVDAPVTLMDKWHHGSLTKSMTATLAAVMVEEGAITWTTTVGGVFPAKVAGMASGWSNVTLEQLLSNTAGAPGDLGAGGVWNTLWNFTGTPLQARDQLIELVTAQGLRYSPGSGYEYSNAGFAIAGAMLEETAGKPWEALIVEKLFGPLGLHSVGFGVPATPRHLNHPLGHSGTVSSPQVWEPSRSADNPAAIGPAGTVHMSILDMARYVAFHLAGTQDTAGLLLSPASFDKLHAEVGSNQYGMGWGVYNLAWAGGKALQHTGSNTQWYTNVWIMPEKNWACVVCTNFGGTNAFQATDAVVARMLGEFPLD